MEVKKAIIPIAGLGTRFLPLSKAVPKELWPLVDKPFIQYTIEEAKDSGISQIVFVISAGKKGIVDYFKKSPKLEKILKDKRKNHLLEELKELQKLCQGISFSYVFQKKPLGDGHAVLQAKKIIKNEPCFVIYPDDIIDSKTPCISQLSQIFKTTQRPVMALAQVSRKKFPFYGIVAGEKIATRLYKVKKIIEKPKIDEAPSNLAIVGRRIITPEVFDYLKRTAPDKKGEISLSETLAQMLKGGKIIYGYEFEGRWLECGNKLEWLKSHLYLSFKHPEYGPQLKKFLKEEKL